MVPQLLHPSPTEQCYTKHTESISKNNAEHQPSSVPNQQQWLALNYCVNAP